MTASIPWEDTSGTFFDRLWTTVWNATRDPVPTFARLGDAAGERDLGLAARFAVLTSVIGWAPFLLLVPCLAIVPFAFASSLPDRVRDLGLSAFCVFVGALPFVFVLGSVGVELVHAAIFHALSRLVGGVGDPRGSLHVMLYTSAIRFWLLPALFLGMVPFVGTMIHGAVRVAFVLWSGFACYGAARGLHKLDDNSALIVAILTPLISIGFVAFCIALAAFALVAAFAGTLSFVDLLGSGAG